MPQNGTNNLIRIIHTGKSLLGWDDETYRAILLRLTGKRSARHCNATELELVVGEMRSKGFTPQRVSRHGRRPHVAIERKAVLSKIEALLTDAGRPWSYAESTAEHMFKQKVLEWLSDKQLTKLMKALIVDAQRRCKKSDTI